MVSILSFAFFSLAFTKPNTKFLDYPIEYSQLSGVFKGKPTPRILFYTPNNLINFTNENGTILIGKIDKKTQENNNVTYYLSLYMSKKKVMLFQFTLTINDDEECNYMTYSKVKNVETGMIAEFIYDGSAESLGRVIGGFTETANYLFNVAEINKSFVSQEDSSSSDESIQDTNTVITDDNK
jgi:hypothetical protein